MPNDPKTILLIVYLCGGLLMIVLGVPLWLGWVHPNLLYGFRTSRTLADPKLWYPVNADSGKRLIGAGLTIIAGAIGFYFVPRWRVEHYAIANLAVTAVSVAYAIAQSALLLRKLTREPPPHPKKPAVPEVPEEFPQTDSDGDDPSEKRD